MFLWYAAIKMIYMSVCVSGVMGQELFGNSSQNDTASNPHFLHDFDGELLPIVKLVASHMCGQHQTVLVKHFSTDDETLQGT